jgi:hypothetical protein
MLEKRHPFQQMVLGKQVIYMLKARTKLYLTTYKEITTKLIKYFNVRTVILKLVKEEQIKTTLRLPTYKKTNNKCW